MLFRSAADETAASSACFGVPVLRPCPRRGVVPSGGVAGLVRYCCVGGSVLRAALVGVPSVRLCWPGLLFSGVDGLLDGAKKEEDDGPGGWRWCVGWGSGGFLRRRPGPEQSVLGARRRPMRHHWLHPSRWRWCHLRLITLSGKGLGLLHGSAMALLLRHLHLGWKRKISWSSVFFLYLLLYWLCTLCLL